MKKCPFCAESIQDEAIKCRYCQSFLEGGSGADSAGGGSETADSPATSTAGPAVAEKAASKSSPSSDDWEDSLPSAGSKNPHPMLLKPEVATSPEPKAASQASSSEDEPLSKRRVLYAGSPSWRAFFNQYAVVVLAALIIPFITIWFAGLFDAGGFTKFLAVAIPLFIAGVAFFAINIYRKSKIFRVTTTNIESEYGLLSKKIDVLELWRCRDVRYQQSLMDRILGIAHIEVMTADVTTPQLCINGLPASRQLFEKIRDSIEIQRQARNVVGFVQ